MSRTTLSVTLALIAAACAVAGSAFGSSQEFSDGHLQLRLPSGWSGSVGPGTQIVAGRPRGVAWMLAGNFGFPDDAARHEGSPSVPSNAVLVTIGDFVLTGAARRWPQAQRLRLPAQRFAWNVRFAGRAVRLSVRFGSKPDAKLRALANALLASAVRATSAK